MLICSHGGTGVLAYFEPRSRFENGRWPSLSLDSFQAEAHTSPHHRQRLYARCQASVAERRDRAPACLWGVS